ncbi:MAG: prolipoprotein diacylglyceryl transferase [Edaphobacter sp.]|uniref:prolipoprotein diacylglyceryl transferase n=1 Tax=Edaphobacter sp. TaxID=1934404 RepID=UPI00239193E2|nr:prolipoprotein diacylglyceryl transferase family protein [Edaphobacter sp.]MDE1176536.1 prolipoprotein diacylglyceryl transferase [Edaphobacter sp.]
MHPNFLHFGFLTIPTFGVLAAIGLMASLTLSVRTAAAVGLNADRVWDAGLFAIIAAFVISRALLVATNLKSFLSYPILLLMVPSLTPLGLLLTVVALLVYLRVRGLPLLPLLDAWAPCGVLTWAFLALGHYVEGSDPGTPSNLPWATTVIADKVRVHPVGVYAAIAAFLITAVLYRLLPLRRRNGDLFALAFALCGLAQFLLTFVREPAFFDTAMGNLLDPIQWVALGMIAIAGIVWQQPRKQVAHAV